jgi:hypothetical protein
MVLPKAATYKVDTDSRDITLRVRIICESQQQAGLSDSGVSDKEKLEQVIVSGSFVSDRSKRFRHRVVACAQVSSIECHYSREKGTL